MATNSDDSLLRLIVIGVGIVIAVLLLIPLLMMIFGFSMRGMMGWGMPGPGIGMSPFWVLGMILLLLIVLGSLGYFLYRAVS